MRAYVPKPGSRYYIEPEAYRHVVSWCRCYPLWKKELATLPDTSKAVTYDKDKVQTSSDYDATAELAIRRVELEHKITLLETTVQAVAPEIYRWMMKGITENGYTTEDLRRQGMPCGRDYFAAKKAKIYFMLNRRI